MASDSHDPFQIEGQCNTQQPWGRSECVIVQYTGGISKPLKSLVPVPYNQASDKPLSTFQQIGQKNQMATTLQTVQLEKLRWEWRFDHQYQSEINLIQSLQASD